MSFELHKLQKFTNFLQEKDAALLDRVSPLRITQDGELFSTAGSTYFTDEDWNKVTELWRGWNPFLD